MNTLWSFLSSLLTGVGAAVAFTVAVMLVLHYVCRASVIVNALISLLLLALSSFQFVLIFGAEAIRGYADLALETAQMGTAMADEESIQTLVGEVPALGDYISTAASVVNDRAVTLHQLVSDLIGGYILRRWMWLGIFTLIAIGAGYLLPSRRRHRKYAVDSLSTGSYSTSGTPSSSLNF